MRYFVTGASGWIGTALIPELHAAGHQVVGLARSDAAAETVSALGAEVRRGGIDDLEVLREAAQESDGVVHLAFRHDIAFSGDFAGAATSDRRAVEVFGEVLAGSDRPLAIASGVLGATPGLLLTERDGHDGLPEGTQPGPAGRYATAEYTLALAERGVRSIVVRLAPTNHGAGDNGFMRAIVDGVQQAGAAGYVGDGDTRWPAVHRLDTAHLIALAMERAPAGSTVHAVAEEGVPFRAIAERLGDLLGLPVASLTPEQAPQHYGWLADFVQLDTPVSNALTKRLLGWEPTQPGLLDDLATYV